MLQKFVESLLVAGTITALLIELIKQQWKKKYGEMVKKDAGGNEVHTVSPFPSWLGLVLGAGISCISALLVYLAWLRSESWWTYPVLAVAVFLYQYFVLGDHQTDREGFAQATDGRQS